MHKPLPLGFVATDAVQQVKQAGTVPLRAESLSVVRVVRSLLLPDVGDQMKIAQEIREGQPVPAVRPARLENQSYRLSGAGSRQQRLRPAPAEDFWA